MQSKESGFPHKARMEEAFATFRNAADALRETMVLMEGRLLASFTDASDEEICYVELWLRQLRDRFKETDTKVGHLKELNSKRALHQWYNREDNVKLYGHTFRLDFHLIPSLPKDRTQERKQVMDWLIAGQRMDCLVMDEGSGEWVFDFKKMEQLVNEMLSQGQRPPESIKLHPKTKIVVRAEK